MGDELGNIAVVVVGDFGRSPRMQYHTLSLANHGYNVSVVAAQGSPPIRQLQNHDKVHINLIKDLRLLFWPRLLRYVTKTVFQTVMLLWHLLIRIPRPRAILVQNPPSVPAVPCVWLACKIRGAKFIVDWHNYGFTILGMSLREESILVKLYRFIEFYFGAKAECGFCVSEAMKSDLASKGIVNITVLHDKPPARFQPIEWGKQECLKKVHEVLVRLSVTPGISGMPDLAESATNTVLTRREPSGKVILKPRTERPLLLVSTTSWTEDEDFGLLFAALKKYDKAAQPEASSIICIVTGQGPQKEFYVEKISRLKLNKVKIMTPWLEIEDYPFVLSLCDLGVCLHKSSSSLDLPMKIADMFGCCVPVLAWNYRCISELVQPNSTGLLFESSDQLCRHLLKMCDVKSAPLLDGWRENIRRWQELRWERHWEMCAKDAFL
ncbi:chitobiosyldiphosphodolichol beta-mannosyltransferase-like [Varroa jacobsoni]|uniref:Beta-1,4-mannosyltransferase n=1 Tax=Varroa destructor TaxID=109461 RepID=A0A7M7KKJ4_VARDE|nr:chitobiosyldiphosphodolichol beta-mannosyltransferase-like [Varroa destructor]XP_022662326.1 chitobiosyldiphosphodolichol beta-mannosyltransferase-like [Varroa destructor]XP_022662327.1 chitobiosyldiphosphodolichol beta-mannosyltransferase-like [Varroa destructor]XP_022699203.1 chitobiosyldiphosphodolichol beta-mannosyltransferase-like [Varroa jacobsoni]XP_022699204.1 chitobiosyldiphosphodolichol beta-mannosyltransferase-like [Varroa jacobsoni]XP_022699205.1 chitobiosyldiphosphodolichol bet